MPEDKPIALPRARILLVDDDERNLLALSHVLQDVAEIVTASSGRDALRLLLQGDFAVILLDVFMPGMDGYEVATLIREREQTARIPIIFVSAVNKEMEHLVRGYEMGAVDYVFKPVEPLILRSKTSVFVDLYNMRQQVEARSRAEQEMREAKLRAEVDRLQILGELQASRARLAAMLELMPLALFEGREDEAGNLVRSFVGGNLAKIIGTDAGAIEAGKAAWEARIHPEDLVHLANVQRSGDQMLASGYRWCGSDSAVYHFAEQCVPFTDADGNPRWACTVFDMTERRQLEAQLLQAGKLDAIGKLTGGVAHDFNNLLAVMLGGLDILQRKHRFEGRDGIVVEQMRQAATKGADLVRHMLAFARRQDLAPVSIRPESISEAVAGLVKPTLGGAISVDWRCSETVLNFYADPTQLELALVNLIINARDAMPGGGVIDVEIDDAPADRIARANLPPGAYLAITVRDRGVGIPPELVEKIIEPFFTTKAVGKGTGLGLSMVVGFVQQSGGMLHIASEPGTGTEVTLLLPATLETAAVDEVEEEMALALEGMEKSILVVDDDDAVRTVLCAQLRDLGMQVVEVSSGQAAIEVLRNPPCQFDLIITDFAMPQLNGMQTVTEARRLVPGLRACIMTGYAGDALDSTDDIIVLHKPVSVAELERALS